MTVPTIRVTWAFPPDLYDALTAEASHKGISMTAHGIGKLRSWDGLLAACELAIESEECMCGGNKDAPCMHCILTAAIKAAKL